MPAALTARMTAAQYFELGEDPPGVRLELVDGEIEMSPSPTPRHSYPEMDLGALLHLHVRERDLGVVLRDIDTPIGPHDVRRPGLLFFRKDRLHLVGPDRIEGIPDLCIEIISPSSRITDRREKSELYAAAGVRHYWIVDPIARTAEAFELREGVYELIALGSHTDNVSFPPFPDLEIPLGRLWQPSRLGP